MPVSVRLSEHRPGTVRVVYAAPADREFRSHYSEAITNLMLDIQSWYRQQVGGLTFSLYEATPEFCQMSEPSGFYARYSWETVVAGVQHCAPAGHGDPDYRWVIFPDVVHECGPPGLGYDELGRGGDGLTLLSRWDLDGLVGDDGLFGYCDGDQLYGPYDRPLSSWKGGTAHELAHAFGLPHPPGCDPWHPTTCDDLEAGSLMHDGYAEYPDTYLLRQTRNSWQTRHISHQCKEGRRQPCQASLV